jgi:hypothetical protein
MLTAVPFEPFDILMANGERLHVPHQDFVWAPPPPRPVMVALPEIKTRNLNWNLVVGIEKKTAHH